MIVYYTIRDNHHIEAVKIRGDRVGDFFEFIMRKEGEVYILDIRDDEIEIINFDQLKGRYFSHDNLHTEFKPDYIAEPKPFKIEFNWRNEK